MNKTIESFVENLKARADVVGVILFGSWARGNNRQDSDIDLMVVLSDGFKRTVEYKDNLAFEITYTTEQSAIEYWESHKDDCAGFWGVAKILYDKDGTMKKLEEFARGMIEKGKKPLDEIKIDHLRFDAQDSLGAIKNLTTEDSVLSNFLLTKKMLDLSELFFDIRQLWIPAPKQRLSKIKEIDQELFNLLVQFYQEGVALTEKVKIVEKVISIVFKN